MAEKNIDVAQESSVQEVNEKIGSTGDTGGSASAGTIMAKLNGIFNRVADNHTGSATGTLSQKITHVLNTLGVTGDTGGSATAGTVMGKLNKLITDLTTHIGVWTSTRAGYVDNIRSYTVTNNTASKTGVLSAKLAYVISLLENTTYGLSAIKSNSGAIKSVQRGTVFLDRVYNKNITISAVNLSKTFVNIYGPGGKQDNSDLISNQQVAGVLTSTTNLAVSSSTYDVYIYWEVVEFK